MREKIRLPPKLAVLDIETATIRRRPEQCEFAVAGVEVYVRHGISYRSNGYTPYLQPDLPDLETFLRSFPGLIIGHNIFDFDYRILRGHISLEGVIEKTIDTLWFLRQKDKKGWASLKLDLLSEINFGKGKATQSRKIPLLWQEGKRKRVLSYNRTDCQLTYKLWWRMVHKRSLLTNSPVISILAKDVASLTARKPAISYAAWLRQMEDGGQIFKRPKPKISYLNDVELKPDDHPVFFEIECKHCGRHFILVASRRKFVRGEKLVCPICEKQTPFARVRVLVKNWIEENGISRQLYVANPFVEKIIEPRNPEGKFVFIEMHPDDAWDKYGLSQSDIALARKWLSRISWRGRWG
jgi:hypothetical protein